MNSLSPTSAGLVLGQGVLTGDLGSGEQWEGWGRDRDGKGKGAETRSKEIRIGRAV